MPKKFTAFMLCLFIFLCLLAGHVWAEQTRIVGSLGEFNAEKPIMQGTENAVEFLQSLQEIYDMELDSSSPLDSVTIDWELYRLYDYKKPCEDYYQWLRDKGYEQTVACLDDSSDLNLFSQLFEKPGKSLLLVSCFIDDHYKYVEMNVLDLEPLGDDMISTLRSALLEQASLRNNTGTLYDKGILDSLEYFNGEKSIKQGTESAANILREILNLRSESFPSLESVSIDCEVYRFLDYKIYEDYAQWLQDKGYEQTAAYSDDFFKGFFQLFEKADQSLLLQLYNGRSSLGLTIADMSPLGNDVASVLRPTLLEQTSLRDENDVTFSGLQSGEKMHEYGYQKVMGSLAFSLENMTTTLAAVYETLLIDVPEIPAFAVNDPNPYETQLGGLEMAYVSGEKPFQEYLTRLQEQGFPVMFKQAVYGDNEEGEVLILGREPDQGRLLLFLVKQKQSCDIWITGMLDCSYLPYSAFETLYRIQGAALPPI